MPSEYAKKFGYFGQFLDHLTLQILSDLDAERIANVVETIRLFEADLRSRYKSITILEAPLTNSLFSQDVSALGVEVISERGRGAYNTNNLILYALIEARLQAEEKFLTPQEIASRIDRVVETVISSKGTAQNLLQPPYFLESKRKMGWRLRKSEHGNDT